MSAVFDKVVEDLTAAGLVQVAEEYHNTIWGYFPFRPNLLLVVFEESDLLDQVFVDRVRATMRFVEGGVDEMREIAIDCRENSRLPAGHLEYPRMAYTLAQAVIMAAVLTAFAATC